MMLLLHVVLAISSLVYTTALYLSPSKRKIRAAYGLVTATLASGTYLVMSTHSALVSPCLSGVLYLVVATTGIVVARRKLALAYARTK